MVKIKKGDYLRVCIDDNHTDLTAWKGKLIVAERDETTDATGLPCIRIMDKDGKSITPQSSDGYRVSRFETLTVKEASELKEKPVERFAVFKESCMNFQFMANSLEDAQKVKPSYGDTFLIFKLIPVAKANWKYDVEKVE